MRKLKFFAGIIAGISLFTMVSCKNEITITAQTDGSVNVSFSGECGKYFESMIRNFSESDSELLFDGPGIRQSFIKDGFKNVQVMVPGRASLKTNMNVPSNTYLFTSGLLFCDKKNVYVNLTPDILKKFYESADDDILSVLDLLLAPVFNDEEMTEEEYLETIGSFYGQDATDEIEECKIKLSLISTNGEAKNYSLPLKTLLTLQNRITY